MRWRRSSPTCRPRGRTSPSPGGWPACGLPWPAQERWCQSRQSLKAHHPTVMRVGQEAGGAPLAGDQLEVLATAAYLAGLDAASDQAWTRAFHIHQRADEPQRAVRCAFWLAFRLLNAGDVPQGSGWVARIRRLLERCPDGVEQGYGSYAYALQSIFGGDASGAEHKFAAAAEL